MRWEVKKVKRWNVDCFVFIQQSKEYEQDIHEIVSEVW
jgi:hypothetical protein